MSIQPEELLSIASEEFLADNPSERFLSEDRDPFATPDEAYTDDSDWHFKVFLALAAAFVVARVMAARHAREAKESDLDARKKRLEESGAVFSSVYAEHARDALLRVYSDAAEPSLMALTHAKGVGGYLSAVMVEAAMEGYLSAVNAGVPEAIAYERAATGFGLDKAQMRRWMPVALGGKDEYQPSVVSAAGMKMLDRLLLERANRVSDHELFVARGVAKQARWAWWAARGKIPTDSMKLWVTADDERVCPVCGPMDGTTVHISSPFTVAGRKTWATGVHPNCRCVIQLVVPAEIRKAFTTAEGKHDPRDRDAKGQFAAQEGRKRSVTHAEPTRSYMDVLRDAGATVAPPALERAPEPEPEAAPVKPVASPFAPGKSVASPFARSAFAAPTSSYDPNAWMTASVAPAAPEPAAPVAAPSQPVKSPFARTPEAAPAPPVKSPFAREATPTPSVKSPFAKPEMKTRQLPKAWLELDPVYPPDEEDFPDEVRYDPVHASGRGVFKIRAFEPTAPDAPATARYEVERIEDLVGRFVDFDEQGVVVNDFESIGSLMAMGYRDELRNAGAGITGAVESAAAPARDEIRRDLRRRIMESPETVRDSVNAAVEEAKRRAYAQERTDWIVEMEQDIQGFGNGADPMEWAAEILNSGANTDMERVVSEMLLRNAGAPAKSYEDSIRDMLADGDVDLEAALAAGEDWMDASAVPIIVRFGDAHRGEVNGWVPRQTGQITEASGKYEITRVEPVQMRGVLGLDNEFRALGIDPRVAEAMTTFGRYLLIDLKAVPEEVYQAGVAAGYGVGGDPDYPIPLLPTRSGGFSTILSREEAEAAQSAEGGDAHAPLRGDQQ